MTPLHEAGDTRCGQAMSRAVPAADRSVGSTLVACGVLSVTVLILVALGHDGSRIAQLCSLAAPVLALMLWPVQSLPAHRLRTAVVWLWAMAFAFDGIVRACLLETYHAAPNSAMVVGAAANTNLRESLEYVSMYWRSLLSWALGLLLAGAVLGRYAHRGARHPKLWPRWGKVLMCTLLLASLAVYSNKPSRRLHPLAFWIGWNETVTAQRAGWTRLHQARDEALLRARSAAPVVTQAGPATVMLVIGESINRDNLALYGYGRNTSPRLLAHKEQLGDSMVVLRNAWSVDASTLPAMDSLFNFGQAPIKNPMHVLALARAAGYKVWWISNQDDLAIEQLHGRMADITQMVNRRPGRASVSLDGAVLASVQEALGDTAPRKLVVVHLMGAHPHYSLRTPEGENAFDDNVDVIDADMARLGRSRWVRETRQAYDSAVLYHDRIVSELLQMTHTAPPANGYRGWMYLSDHGQEVGHSGDQAGHSPATASGYRIPAVVWRNRQATPPPPGMATEPFRADWAAWTLADLLRLQWTGQKPERNVLDARYQWQAPTTLPLALRSFRD